MARVFDLDFSGARLLSRDFAGQKFGPDQRQFRIEIEDQQLVEKLIKDGVNLWQPDRVDSDEPIRSYMNVKVSYRFGAPDIAMVTPEGNAIVLTEKTVDELDTAWIKNTEMHVHGSTYERMGRTGVTVYLDTLVVWLMSNAEREEIVAENQSRSNPVKDRFRKLFEG